MIRWWIQVEIVTSSSIESPDLMLIDQESLDWRTQIKKYILEEEEPAKSMEKRKVKNKATCFTVINDKLYKKSLHEGSPFRIYVYEEEGSLIAHNIHSGRGGAHQGSRKLASQIKRQGY